MLKRLFLAMVLALAAVPAAAQLFGQPELLEPEKAFRISARALDERSVEVEFKIAEGYYMYRDRFSFATESGKPLAEVEIPRGKVKEDQFFGKTETFRDLVRIRVPVSPEDAAQGRLNLKVTSQGCSDKGVCYTPLEQMVRVSLPGADARPAVRASSPIRLQIPWLLLAASLGAGLALGWASAGAPLGRAGTARMATAGLAAWALALAASGGLFGWLGSLVERRAETPWIAGSLALAYVVAAGLWFRWSMRRGEFNWPVRAARDIVLLAAVLLFAAYLGDPWIGAAVTAGTGLAAGLFLKEHSEAQHPLALQGVALAMLAAAAWMAAPVLPDELRMLAWASWLVLAAALLGAVESLPAEAPALARLGKTLGIGLLVWGVAIAVGAFGGSRDPLQPLAGLRATRSDAGQNSAVRFERVATLAELESRVASARRPVMLDFYADWCVSCKEMERFTFSEPQVRSRMERMLLLQVDVTRNTHEDQAMLRRFRLFGPPGIIFFDAEGRELQHLRVVGFQPADRFVRVLDRALQASAEARPS